ncbi:hypothetical protein BGZ93_007587 [Podila epicladia]|nr:hypothetical protein BGZ93_007587 [Podila epicladia]
MSAWAMFVGNRGTSTFISSGDDGIGESRDVQKYVYQKRGKQVSLYFLRLGIVRNGKDGPFDTALT